MLPGTALVSPNMRVRGTPKAILGEITQAQLDAEAASQASALQYAMENIKSAREDAARAQERAEARASEQEATARMERVQQQALDAAQTAAEQSAAIQGGILITSKSSLNKVLVTVGAGMLASYILFALVSKGRKAAA